MFIKLAPRLVAIVLILSIFISCSSLSKISHFAATDSKRQELLEERLEKFCKDVYWGSTGDARDYVYPPVAQEFIQMLSKREKSQRLVEVNVRSVEFDNEVKTATVVVESQFYQTPTYLMQKRSDEQVWKYHRLDGGWLVHQSRQIDNPQIINDDATEDLSSSFGLEGSNQ